MISVTRTCYPSAVGTCITQMCCSSFEMLTAACTNIQSLVKLLKMRHFKVEDIKMSSVLCRRNPKLREFWNLSWYWVAEIYQGV